MTDIVSTFDSTDAEYIDDDAVQGPGVFQGFNKAPETLEEADAEHWQRLIAEDGMRHQIANEPSRQRYAQESAARDASERERIAAAGGEGIATELRGDVGDAVAGVLRLDRIAEAARKVEHRITEEQREMAARTIRDRDAELLEAAWSAAASKTKVPPIVAPAWEHATREVPGEHRIGSDWTARRLLEQLRQRHAAQNRARVVESLADVDRVLVETAENILTAAGSAADTLTAAGLTVDASAEDVVEHSGAEVLAAWRAWRDAVAAWGDLQSVRRWVSVAVDRGFREQDPERLAYGEGVADVEAGAWRTQFAGVGVPVGVAGPHAALVWWTEQGRPASTGVGSIETGVEQ